MSAFHLVLMVKPVKRMGVVDVKEIMKDANVTNVRLDISIPMINVKVMQILNKNTHHFDYH